MATAVKIETYAGEMPENTRGRKLSPETVALQDALRQSLEMGGPQAWKGAGGANSYTKNATKLRLLAKKLGQGSPRIALDGQDLVFQAVAAPAPEPEPEAPVIAPQSAPKKATGKR